MHARELLNGLEAVECPSDLAGGGAGNLSDYLVGNVTPEASVMLTSEWNAGSQRELTLEDANRAGELVAPLMDRFIELYHRTFSGLAAAAEMSENYLVPKAQEEADAKEFHPGFKMRSASGAPASAPALA